MEMVPPPAWGILTSRWWQLSPRESTRLWAALARSQAERPRAMRQQVTLLGVIRMDMDHCFLRVLTPTIVLDTVEDLVQGRQLRRAEGSRIEERILAQVDARGQWKDEQL